MNWFRLFGRPGVAQNRPATGQPTIPPTVTLRPSHPPPREETEKPRMITSRVSKEEMEEAGEIIARFASAMFACEKDAVVCMMATAATMLAAEVNRGSWPKDHAASAGAMFDVMVKGCINDGGIDDAD